MRAGRRSSLSLVFSGFTKPYVPFESYKLFVVGQQAQYEIVQAVVQNRGDGPIAQPNLEWCRSNVCLSINHNVDDKMT